MKRWYVFIKQCCVTTTIIIFASDLLINANRKVSSMSRYWSTMTKLFALTPTNRTVAIALIVIRNNSISAAIVQPLNLSCSALYIYLATNCSPVFAHQFYQRSTKDKFPKLLRLLCIVSYLLVCADYCYRFSSVQKIIQKVGLMSYSLTSSFKRWEGRNLIIKNYFSKRFTNNLSSIHICDPTVRITENMHIKYQQIFIIQNCFQNRKLFSQSFKQKFQRTSKLGT